MNWNNGLSVRATNCVYTLLEMKSFTGVSVECEKVKCMDSDSVKDIVSDKILNEKINLMRVKNCGRRTLNEIYSWCGISLGRKVRAV